MITLKIIILGLGERVSGRAAPDVPGSSGGGPGGLAKHEACTELTLETVSPWSGTDSSWVACRGLGGHGLGQGLSTGCLRPGVYSKNLRGNHSLEDRSEAELQDGRRVRNGDHQSTHKCIRNASICGTTPTEHLLNGGRRPQTSQKARNSPRTWVGQRKKEKTVTKE